VTGAPLKLLFVMPYLPSPPRFGGQRRIHGLLTELASRHEVSIVSLFDPAEEQESSLRATRAYSRRVITVPGTKRNALGAAKRALQIGSMLSPWSYEAICYREGGLQRQLDRCLAEEPFDVVQFEFAQMAVYRRPARRSWRCVLDEHNIEYDVVRRTAEAEVGALRRGYSSVNWRKLRREERAAWRSFDGCVVTSARDQEVLLADEPQARTALVPNGVDVREFAPTQGPEEQGLVLFFGSISYYPNTEGLLYFLREIWPRVKERNPRARFRVVGPNPPPAIARWSDPSVEVAGYVDDVRTEIARAAVIVAPLRIGGGTRLKVLEAMALGKAIVSTTLGAEGIDLTDGQDIVLADAPELFADRVASLLADGPTRRRLGDAARRLAVERYSWRAAAAQLAGFYESLIRGARDAGPR
jgi:polysaccharide biosynthesis protein PslH